MDGKVEAKSKKLSWFLSCLTGAPVDLDPHTLHTLSQERKTCVLQGESGLK